MGGIDVVPETLAQAIQRESAREGVLGEIVRQGESRVQAQIEFAKAADARAMQLLAAASALAAGVAALLGAVVGRPEQSMLIWGLSSALVGLLYSAWHSIRSAWPRDMQPLGWNPKSFVQDVLEGRSIEHIYCDIADSLERRLGVNDAVISQCGYHTKVAMAVLPTSIFAGIAAGAAQYALNRSKMVGPMSLICAIVVYAALAWHLKTFRRASTLHT